MAELKKLPIGIEDFEKIRQEDFYYVDKTRLIEQLLMSLISVVIIGQIQGLHQRITGRTQAETV